MLIGQYVVDQPRCGLENMAIDQAMLEQTAKDSVFRVRFYLWSQPTVSLGYFQKFQEFLDYQPGCQLPVVRRATGGGAIVHHYDWTYSISAPALALSRQASVGASTKLYDCVHRAVVDWLARRGACAALWESPGVANEAISGQGCGANQVNRAGQGIWDSQRKRGTCDFLCFHRRHAGDVVIGRSKIMGSAQRRHAGAMLQHGSLLLARSPHAPSLQGLEQVATDSGPFVLEEFSGHILEAISRCYQIDFQGWKSLDPLVSPNDAILERLESQQWIGRM